jgi:hypothetical protein
MPAFIPTLQKNFKLNVVDGLPQAVVEKVGTTHLLRCCPLCGCTHQILALDVNSPYTPLCQSFSLLYKVQEAAWHKLHPDVAQYATLHLVLRNAK